MDELQWVSRTVQQRPAEIGSWSSEPDNESESLTVAFVHGFACTPRHADRRSLENLLTVLASMGANIRVIAPQLPGFGGSAPLAPADFSLDDYADWYVDCLDVMNVTGPVVMLGESLGGALSNLVAARRPEMVRAVLVFNSAGGHMPKRNRLQWMFGVVRMANPKVDSVRQWCSSIFDAAMLLRHPLVMWRLSGLIIHADLSGQLALVAHNQTPVVAVFSKNDPLVLENSSATYREGLGIEPLFIVGDHRSFIEQHPAVAALLCAVVDSVVSGRTIGHDPALWLGADALRNAGISWTARNDDE